MVLGVLVGVAVLGLIVGGIALVVRGGRGSLDLAPRNVVRLYLYIASLAGIVVLVVGLSGVLNAGFAAAFGNGFVYGDSSRVAVPPSCPPGAVGCPPQQPDFETQQRQQLDRRRADDLIRGLTFTVFGAAFWGAHWAARRGVATGEELQSALHRSYLMLGTVVFGLSTIVLLATGIYQALSYLILPVVANTFRQGVGDSLAGGIVTLPVWLIYLWLVVRDLRATRAIAPPTA
jgi:hypothetical protein